MASRFRQRPANAAAAHGDAALREFRDFERRLVLAAQRQRLQCGDRDLALVLQRVGERRLRRRGAAATPADLPIAAKSADRAPGTGPGTVVHSEAVGPRIRILRVVRPPGLTFLPGQYVKLGLPGGKHNDYSIASAPADPYLEFCIENVAAGRVSPQLAGLREGDQVVVGLPAKGKFLLDAAADTHLMVATTTGIAPLRSMIVDALQAPRTTRFVVLHGASHADELPYLEELRRLADENPERLKYVPTVSRPDDERNRAWTGRSGRVDVIAAESFTASELPRGSSRAYACGNRGMIQSIKAQAEAAGVPVTTEAFD